MTGKWQADVSGAQHEGGTNETRAVLRVAHPPAIPIPSCSSLHVFSAASGGVFSASERLNHGPRDKDARTLIASSCSPAERAVRFFACVWERAPPGRLAPSMRPRPPRQPPPHLTFLSAHRLRGKKTGGIKDRELDLPTEWDCSWVELRFYQMKGTQIFW